MRKKVLTLSIITLIIFTTFGGLIAVNSFAGTLGTDYVFIPDVQYTNASLESSGLHVFNNSFDSGSYHYEDKTYVGRLSSDPIKFSYYGASGNGFVCSSPLENNYIAVLKVSDRYNKNDGTFVDTSYSLNQFLLSSFNHTYQLYYNGGSTARTPVLNLTLFLSVTNALEAQSDGIWEEPEPVDPSYQFDINLGYLKNVQWKQIAVPSTNETMLEISYDQYTTTGVNLMNSGMGVMCRYQAYNSVDSTRPFWHSTPILTTPGQVLQVVVDWIKESESLVLQSIGLDGVLPGPGGGGHSFGKPEGNHTDSNGVQINNSIYYFDVILTPYYYDGVDYYYGYNTTINDVYFDYIGNRIIPTENDFVDTDTYLNNGSVNNFYYDYGLESNYIDESTNFYYYTTNNVFNYTGVTDDPTEITFNDIENSTNNVYNFNGVGSIPDIDFDGFNVSAAEMLNAIRGVLTAMVVASPLLMGLFDFLPFWAISIAVSCCIAVCVICVIRIFKVV